MRLASFTPPSRRRNTFFFHQPSRRCDAIRCIVARFTSDASKDIWTSFDLSVNACLSSFDSIRLASASEPEKVRRHFCFCRWCTRVVVIRNAASSYESSKTPSPAVFGFLSRCLSSFCCFLRADLVSSWPCRDIEYNKAVNETKGAVVDK